MVTEITDCSGQYIIHFFHFEITCNLVKKVRFLMLFICLTISQLFRVVITRSGACHRRHTLRWEKKVRFLMLFICLTISQLFRVVLTRSGACHRRHTLRWEKLCCKWQASDSLIWQKQLITYTVMSF